MESLVVGSFIYHINLEEGVVVAEFKGGREQLISEMVDELYNNDLFRMCHRAQIEKSLPRHITGKAVCSEEDEFDLEKGMEIARNKCLAKLYKLKTNFTIDISNEFAQAYDDLEEKICKFAAKSMDYQKRHLISMTRKEDK